MPGVAKVGASIVGTGIVLGPGAPTVLVEGLPISCVGDAASPHGDAPHTSPTIVSGSATVFAGGRPVAIQGQSIASCAHPVATGAVTVQAT